MIGPLQLTVIGFDEDKYARDIILEIKNLRKAKVIRLFDLLYIFKHEDGTVDAKEVSDLEAEEQREFGTVVKSLLGLSTKDVAHAEVGEVAASISSADAEFGMSESEIQNIAAELPNGSSAIMVIFEHTWARGVKAAMLNVGGYVRAQGFIDPKTLKTATNELAVILEAIDRAEAATMDRLVDVKVDAKAQEEAALAQAAEAMEQAAEAVASAEAREKAAAAALAAAERREQEAVQAVAEAHAREEEARQHTAEVEAKAQAMEDAAFNQVEAVRRAAKRQEEKAMAEAAEVERKAKEIEGKAILRAMNAMVAANVIERQRAREALEAVINARVIDTDTAREAAKSLAAD